MAELLAPPDIEPAVVAALANAGSWVGTRYPNPEPAGAVVRVNASGGDVLDVVVTRQSVIVECWADDDSTAQRAARSASAHLHAAVGLTFAGVFFGHVASTLPVNFPDVEHPTKVRFQFVTTIHSRLTLLETT